MNKNLRNFMAFFGWTESRSEIERQRWYDEQKRKLEDGEEIEPPWITFPNSAPGGWNQGYQELWKSNIWLPFWNGLSSEAQRKYLEKWCPPEDWYESLVSGERNRLQNGEINWFNEQKKKLEADAEIEPPWVAFPLSNSSFG